LIAEEDGYHADHACAVPAAAGGRARAQTRVMRPRALEIQRTLQVLSTQGKLSNTKIMKSEGLRKWGVHVRKSFVVAQSIQQHRYTAKKKKKKNVKTFITFSAFRIQFHVSCLSGRKCRPKMLKSIRACRRPS
jgi:uncharacterized cupredoxin-like copper-binding protein